MKKTIIRLACLLVGLSALSAAGQDPSVEQLLRNQYEQHLVVPRTAFQAKDQEFDSTGKPLKDRRKDDWMIFGPVLVQRFHIDSNAIHLEGPRVALDTDDRHKQKESTPIPLGKPIKIKIHLDHPLGSADEARAILDRVFFPNAETSDYLRPTYLRSDQAVDSERPGHGFNRNRCTEMRTIYAPDPEYSEQARRKRIEGTVTVSAVVDKTGSVSRISIIRPFGWGLDEEAVKTVKRWRFNPRICDGQPVPAEPTVELNFRLY